MSNRVTLSVVVTALIFSFTMTANETSWSGETSIINNGWKCSAEDLAEADFNGGETARIRLAAFRRGDSYPVTFNADKTEAKGTTGNGTPFICVKEKQK
jgi:hypothetical protein